MWCSTTTRSSPTATGDPLAVEADHRAHARVELDIRDLKAGGLTHIPSGVFLANAAWLGLAVLAHNLGRWTLHAAGGRWADATVATLRTKLVAMPARVVRSARTIKLRFPRPLAMARRLRRRPDRNPGDPRAHLIAAAPIPVRHDLIAVTPEPRPAAAARPHPASSRLHRSPATTTSARSTGHHPSRHTTARHEGPIGGLRLTGIRAPSVPGRVSHRQPRRVRNTVPTGP
jgi:hypothetical protein